MFIQKRFNSSLVRLIAWDNYYADRMEDRFNSSLVRLIAGNKLMRPVPVLFQFQFGTIDRLFLAINSIIFNFVSIPVWYD